MPLNQGGTRLVASWQSSNLIVLQVVSTAVGRLQPNPSGVKIVAVVRGNCLKSLIRANMLSASSKK